MVPKHTFVTSMSDAPSLILRRLVLGMSVIVALSLSFSFFLSLSLFVSRSRSPVLSSSRKDAAERKSGDDVSSVGLITCGFYPKICLFPFFFPFFYQTSEPVSSDVLAKRKKRNKTRKKCYTFVERLTNSSFHRWNRNETYKFHRAETKTPFFSREEEEEKCLHHTPHPKLRVIISDYSLKKRCEYSVSGWHKKHEKEEEEVQSCRHKTSHRETT